MAGDHTVQASSSPIYLVLVVEISGFPISILFLPTTFVRPQTEQPLLRSIIIPRIIIPLIIIVQMINFSVCVCWSFGSASGGSTSQRRGGQNHRFGLDFAICSTFRNSNIELQCCEMQIRECRSLLSNHPVQSMPLHSPLSLIQPPSQPSGQTVNIRVFGPIPAQYVYVVV